MHLKHKRLLSWLIFLTVLLCLCAGLALAAETADGWVYTLRGGSVTINRYEGNQTNLTVPSSIEGVSVGRISDFAFASFTDLAGITVPNGVTAIGSSAFQDCAKLTRVSLPDSVIYIGPAAFQNCRSLTSIDLPAGLTSIDYLFTGCTSLSRVTIPAGVTRISRSAFRDCTSLQSLTLPDNITDMDPESFRASTTKYCHAGTATAQTLTTCGFPFVDPHYPTFMLREDYWISSGSDSRLTVFSSFGSASEITIPAEIHGVPVYSIDSMAFEGCTNLTKVTILGSDTRVLDAAFSGCPDLTIYCNIGSDADLYAQANGISVKYLDAPDPGEEPEQEYIPGDANGDGTTDIVDALLVLQYDAGWDVTLSEEHADVNADGLVDILDALLLLQYDAGWDVTLK